MIFESHQLVDVISLGHLSFSHYFQHLLDSLELFRVQSILLQIQRHANWMNIWLNDEFVESFEHDQRQMGLSLLAI